jgi:hypothetical protein
MFKKASTYLIPALFWLASAFTPAPASESWKAILKLEGKTHPVTLTSDAIYGGYNSGNHNIFLFGKNHMFLNKDESESAKVFHDLCTTNAMEKFQFEINGVNSPNPSNKAVSYSGNISFKKRSSVKGSFRLISVAGKKARSIETIGDLKALGFTMTPEAEKLFTGKFTLTFISNN